MRLKLAHHSINLFGRYGLYGRYLLVGFGSGFGHQASSRGQLISSQIDGRTLIQIYGRLGLKLDPAVNAVEAGITETWNLLVSGRLKVQEHLRNWRNEFRKYHRDEQGKIVKSGDHLMDATRYLIISGRSQMRVAPQVTNRSPRRTSQASSWMAH